MMHHSLHGSTSQTDITICFMDGSDGDIVGYLCEDKVFPAQSPLSKLQPTTEYIRFPVRTGQENLMTVGRSDSTVTPL